MASVASRCKLCNVSIDDEQLYQCHHDNCDITYLFCAPCGEHTHFRKKHHFVDHMKEKKLNSDLEEDTKYADDDQYVHCDVQSVSSSTTNKSNISTPVLTTIGGVVGAYIIGTNVAPATGASVVSAVVGSLAPAVPAMCTCVGLTYAYWKTLEPLQSKLWPSEDQKQHKMKMAAVAMFQFHEEDIKHESVFNKEEINKRYHKFAKLYHPDTKKNEEIYFIHIEIAKRILLSMKDPQLEFPADACQLLAESTCDQSVKKQIQWK